MINSFFSPRKKARTVSSLAPSYTTGVVSTKVNSSSVNTKKKEEIVLVSTKRRAPPAQLLPFPASKKWKESDCGTLLYLYPPGTVYSEKIAGFDIDGTVIETKSGKTFATDEITDWKLWSGNTSKIKNVFTKLASSSSEEDGGGGYRIVFFTNQEGISKGKVDKMKWMKKIENVIDTLGLSDKVTVLASLTKKENDHRKPHIGMWNFLCKHLSVDDDKTKDAQQPDTSKSFYVGDAAGRPKRGTMKKDFSCSDYKFALNIGGGIKFMTPQQIFHKSKSPSDMASLSTSNIGFQPKVHWKSYYGDKWSLNQTHPEIQKFLSSFCLMTTSEHKHKQEIIVVVGSPASGKSSLTARVVAATKNNIPTNYVCVNQDTLKTVAKCIKLTTESISSGTKSVIVDNTNRDIKTRKQYIILAKDRGIPCRCVWMTTTKEESFHLNALRGALGMISNKDGSEERRSVLDLAIHSYYKNMTPPTCDEGFDEVIELPFIPGPFHSDEIKEAFFRFTY